MQHKYNGGVAMPQDWQILLGFTSFWNTTFSLLAYLGLIIFMIGISWKRRQAELFLLGGLMLWSFAIYGKNPIFIAAQTLMAAASFMRLKKVVEARAIDIFLTTLFVVGMLSLGLIDSPLRWLGLTAALGLVLGVAFAQTVPGNLLFTAGGILMALFAYLVWSLPFLALNILFTLVVLTELGRQIFSQKSV